MEMDAQKMDVEMAVQDVDVEMDVVVIQQSKNLPFSSRYSQIYVHVLTNVGTFFVTSNTLS